MIRQKHKAWTKYLHTVAAEDVTPSLTYLCNLSLETGQFPKEWKKAMVIPGYKKDLITSKENYRPLSILSVLSKILEKHVFSTYYQYLNNHNLLSNYQHGFRKYQTIRETILMLMFEKLSCNIEKGEITAVTMLDFSKAFDLVDHELLLRKIEIYGITDLSLEWFKSYVDDRQQQVKYKNALTNSKNTEWCLTRINTWPSFILNIYQ